MIEYLKQYVQGASQIDEYGHLVLHPLQSAQEIIREMERFDPRDFEPAVQSATVDLRGVIRAITTSERRRIPSDVYRSILANLLPVLDAYRGPGSFGVSRSFAFLHDADLRKIVERDYAELSAKLFPSGAWKSTVIMAGSILEAMLFDRLSDAAWIAKATVSKAAPKDKKTGKPWPAENWTLAHLIDVAVDIGRLPKDPADTIHQVLRDYRNFVHPKKEIRAAHACTEAEGMLAKGALDSVCNYLEANP